MKTLFAAVLLASVAPAASITLDAASSGRYFDPSTHAPGEYGTGWHAGLSAEARSYFVFDLSAVSGTITSATLRLATNPQFSSYISPDPTETLALFDVSTPLATLTGGFGGFIDLGTGTQLGALTVNSSIGASVDITLNANGITYLNAALGSNTALGAALTTLAKGGGNEIVFNGTNASFTRQLILETNDAPTGVPEPATRLLLSLGLLPVVLRRRT